MAVVPGGLLDQVLQDPSRGQRMVDVRAHHAHVEVDRGELGEGRGGLLLVEPDHLLQRQDRTLAEGRSGGGFGRTLATMQVFMYP